MTDSGNSGGKSPQAALDDLSRDELLQKCKQFLQFAQKAKKAKDDVQKQIAEMNENLNKADLVKVQLRNCNAEKEQLETSLQSKDRQLERAMLENDDLLVQVDTYSGHVKEFNKDNAELKKSLNLAKDTISKLEKQSAKIMEYEANIICLKETEKQKSAFVEDLKKQLDKEKVTNERVNNVVSEVKSELNLVKEINDKQSRHLGTKSKQILELNQEIVTLTINNQRDDGAEEVTIRKENQITQLEDSLSKLRQENEEVLHLFEEAKDNLSKAHVLISDLEKQLFDKNVNEKTVIDLRGKLEATDSGLKEQLIELNEEIKKRGEKLNQFESISEKLAKKKKECKELEDTIVECKQTYESQLREVNLKLCNVEEEMENNNKLLEKEKSKVDEANIEIEQKVKQLSEQEIIVKLLEEQLTTERLKNEKKIKVLKLSFSNNEALLAEITTKLKSLRMDKAKREESLLKMENELATCQEMLKEKCQKIQTLVIAANEHEKSKKTLEEKLSDLEKTTQNMTGILREKNESKTDLSKESVISESKLLEYTSKLEEVQVKLTTGQATLEQKWQEVQSLQISLAEKDEKNKYLEEQIIKLKESLSELSKENSEINKEFSCTKKECELKEQELENIQKENLKKVNVTEDKFKNLTDELTKCRSILVEKEKQIEDLNCNISKSGENILAYIAAGEELKHEHESSQNRLLAEKKILQDEVDKVKQELVEEKKIAAEAIAEIEELKSELSKLSIKYSEVQSEMDKTTESQACIVPPVSGTVDNDDNKSEVMSTSTVSKVEEVNRMRDLEDSFEERYSKLKQLAINLKKKVGSQAKLIAELESRKADNGNNLEEKTKEKFATLTRNFGILQADYDSTVDKVESLGEQVKSLTKDLEASVTESLAAKQKAEEATQEAASAKTESLRLADLLREREAEASALRVTADEERRERKQLQEMVKRGEEAVEKLVERAGEADRSEETATSLKLQIVQLEQTLEKEQERADRAQEMLSGCRSQLNTAEAELTRERTEGAEVCKRVEGLQRNNEEMKEQLVEVTKMTEKENEEARTRMAALERQVNALESQLAARLEDLEGREAEIARVAKEFENYKLRAQSVLKQSKDKVEEDEKMKKQEEIVSLEKVNDTLEEKNKSLRLELNTSVMERDYLQDEHDRLMERHSLLLQELASKERSWRAKFEEVEARMRKQEDEGQLEVEKKQGTIDQMRQLHLQEVQCLKTNNQQEICKLQQQIDQAENDLIRLESVVQREQEFKRETSEIENHKPDVHSTRNSLDIDQMEREAREAPEGQEFEKEYTGGSPIASLSSPLPLEQLLAQPCKGLTDPVEVGRRSSVSSSLGGADRQVAHLAALLSESEAQNARLEKLAEVLKEEIRTYQRSEERHKHIENLEYVKNVILKFLTLTGGQERTQLIPVLATILKLKKAEIQQIKELVKADEEASSSNDGWSGYLHSWSGTT